MANVTRSSSKSKVDEDKSNRETSGLRRSARETPSKQTPSSPLSTRKSERIEKRTPPTTPVKRSSERVEKLKMPSPLTKSERGENHRSSSSSGSRNSENGLNLLDNKYKKEQKDNNVICTPSNTIDRKKDGENIRRPVRVVLGKKRLDARSYRNLFLKSQSKKTQESGLSEKLREHHKTSQGENGRTGTSTSKKVGSESELRNEEVGSKDAEDSGRAVEEPSSALRKLEIGSPSNRMEMELSHPKHHIHTGELHEFNIGGSSPVSIFSRGSPQSSSAVLFKETVSETTLMDCSMKDNPLNALIGSTSEGTSISGDQCLGEAFTLGTSKRKRKAEELDCDPSMTPANEEINSSADPVAPPPSERKIGSSPADWGTCSKKQRSEVDSQKCNMCPCNHGSNFHSDDSLSEEVREKAASSAQGAHKANVDHIDSNSLDESHCSELSPGPESTHDQPEGHSIPAISDPLEEDECELRIRDCIGLNEDCLDKMQLKESPEGSKTQYDCTTCIICKRGGMLLCCNGKGCGRNYHFNCLDPPLKFVPLGAWHCFQCIKKKIQFGVHSVSEGVESIWDVKEEEVRDCEGIQKQNQYLVKYKGLAHVHNRWIAEQQLNLEAPSLLTSFEKNQVSKWKSEWTKPQRLVQKRSLTLCRNQANEILTDCQYEWFVKWSGLGYEHATWELENATFLGTPEAKILVRDYESRLQKAILASDPSTEKLMEERKASFFSLPKFPCTDVSGLDNDHQNFIYKLCEHWHKNQNAVIVDDQERISKVVRFILSIQANVCRPFLIISSSCALSAWEAEFMCSAPSVNVVTYSGDKEVRESIRGLEFYEDGGCVMLQVLLSPIDAIVEDLEAFELIGWEAIVVDECQPSTVSEHLEQIKKLTNGFKLLFHSGAVTESVREYHNLLSFLEPGRDSNGDVSLKVDSGDSLRKLKERFARFIVCERKSDSRFVEYWVPVRLSNVQLEQYCATLLSNAMALCSCSKSDIVGALRDILISLRKSCDHPFLVDLQLPGVLTKGLPEVEFLDVGINASGKLKVLDKILSEIKKRGLRVLIVFQSVGGSGRNRIGDYLDDFLRQRFGAESYERVDGGLLTSKKQAALNMFNNKESGRFLFLIENRACTPIIKLSSVDMAILFDSDWNPLNDLRALQRITIDSEVEQVKVFRLYSSSTVEEKVLSLAKEDMPLDSNIQNISRTTSHMLLLWGANFLFHKLDEFHRDCTQFSTSNIASDQSFLYDVVQEVLSQLDNNEIIEKKNRKVVKAQQSGSSYSKDIILFGEKELLERCDKLPHILWTSLLDGRAPQWRFTSGPSQRIRKKVQYFDESPQKPQENDEVAKKRKRAATNVTDQNILKSYDNKRKAVNVDKEGGSGPSTCDRPENVLSSAGNTPSANHPVLNQAEMHKVGSNDKRNLLASENALPSAVNTHSFDRPVSNQAEIHKVDSNERRNLRDSQRNLHISLKPVISNLCDILQVPVDVKNMAEKFLEYAMNNLAVGGLSETLLQAFQISLCWSAASILKHKISHKKSLALAKEQLNFQCKEEETDAIYSKLSAQRKMFTQQAKCVEPISAGNSSQRDAQQELEDGEIRESPGTPKLPSNLDSSKQQASDCQNASGSSQVEFSESIHKVEKIHRRRMKKIYPKQMEEVKTFNRCMEKEKNALELKHKLESLCVRTVNSQPSVMDEKQKSLDQDFARKKKELAARLEIRQKKLEAMHWTARNEEKKLKTHWLEEAKCGKSVAEYEKLPLSVSGFREENIDELDQVVICQENMNLVASGSSPEREDTVDVVPVLPAEAVSEISPTKLASSTMQLDGRVDDEDALPQEGQVPPLQVPVNEDVEPSVPVNEVPVDEANDPSRVEVGTSQAADAVPLNPSNKDTLVNPPDEQSELLPSADPPSTARTQPDFPASTSVGCEQTNDSLQQLETPIERTNDSFQQLETQTEPPVQDQDVVVGAPLVDPPSSETQPGVPTTTCVEPEGRDGRNDEPQRISPEVQTELITPADPPPENQLRRSVAQPTQVQVQPLQLVQPEVLNRPTSLTIGQPSTSGSGPHLPDTRSMSLLPDFNTRTQHISAASPPVSQQPTPNLFQSEYGRLQKEEHEANSTYEHEKNRLRSECEKEMEEIRRKYNTMIQNAEMEFLQRKKTLETQQHIVTMNRILAEAFKTKNDAITRVAGSPASHQGASPSTSQQVFHSQSASPAQRPGSILGPRPTSSSPQLLHQYSSPQPTQRPIPMPTQHSAPPVQMVRQPSALFSNSPIRSPPYNQLHLPPRNRAPAPHLQPFRPNTSPFPPRPNIHPGGQSSQRSFPPMTGFQSPPPLPHSNNNNPSASALDLLRKMEVRQTTNNPVPNRFSNLPGSTAVHHGSDVVCLSSDDD